MNEKQEKVLKVARSLVGTPYQRGAPPEEGQKHSDCTSFVIYVYMQIGIRLEGRHSHELAYRNGTRIRDWDPVTCAGLEIGDLLYFRGTWGYYRDKYFPGEEIYIGHVAIYAGNGNAIHAADPDQEQGQVGKPGAWEQPLKEIMMGRGPIVVVKRLL